MSFTYRLSTSPASVQRDYALLRAPSTSFRPFQGLTDDVSEASEEDTDSFEGDSEQEQDQGDQDAQQGGRKILSQQRHHQRGRDHTDNRISVASQWSNNEHGAVDDAEGMEAVGSPQSSKRRRSSHQLRSPGTAPLHGGHRRMSSGADGVDHKDLASRARGLLLGGEARPPPVELYGEALQSSQQHSEASSANVLSPRSPSPHLLDNAAPPTTATPPTLQLPPSAVPSLSAPTGPAQPPAYGVQAGAPAWPLAGQTPLPAREDIARTIEEINQDAIKAGRSGIIDTDVEAAVSPVSPFVAANERAPLLANGSGPGASGIVSGYGATAPGTPGLVPPVLPSVAGIGAPMREVKTLMQYSLPIWGTHLLELSLNVVTVFSLGHLGTTELGAASLASMTANVTGFSILSGFVSALDSLLPAAYASEHPWTVGVWTQRMVIILSALVVPIAAIWWTSESILIALGQEPEVAHLASKYLFILSFALPAYAGFETLRRYLQAQGLFSAPTIAVSIASAINVPLNILLVYGPDSVRLGFIGAPVASLISYYLMFFLGLVQCYIAPRDGWSGWTIRAFDPKGLRICWHLGVSSVASMAAEWWAWEIAGLMTSWIGTQALAAQSVLLVTSSIAYQLPYAVAVAAAVRVGNLLGANQPHIAAVSSRVALWMGVGAGCANSSVFFLLRKSWGKLFSDDQEVVDLVATILPVLAAFQIADCICGVGGGILRGSGRQHLSAWINLVSYYVLGLPFALLLLKLDVGLPGIWYGLTIGLYVGAVGTFWVISRTNWFDEARIVLDRMEADTTRNMGPIIAEVAPVLAPVTPTMTSEQ